MLKKILFEQITENNSGGPSGYGDQDAPAPKADSTSNPTTEKEGDTVDEFGYKKEPAAKAEGKESEDKESSKEKDEKSVDDKITDPATGYDVNAEISEEKKDSPPPDEKPEVKNELGYELKLEGLESEDAAMVTEFAKTHKLTKEVAQALVDSKKGEVEKLKSLVESRKKELEQRVKDQKASWQKEMRDDPVFGGEKLGRTIFKAEKLLTEHMPDTKKELTKRGSMLPPYVMRDMVRLYDQLHGTEGMVSGDKGNPAPITSEDNEDSHLDFYKGSN